MPCQICGGAARTVLQKEFNVSCGDYFVGRRLFATDVGRLDLHECVQCGFGYFPAMQAWAEATYRADIYNDDYHLCDQPFLGERPRKLAAWLGAILAPCELIDYGGGQGLLAECLNNQGFNARSCDPFYGSSRVAVGQADVVTAFELVEHVPDQRGLFMDLKSLCKPHGLIIFSTLLKQPVLDHGDWWYAAPRNGHVSMHAADSLKRITSAVGLCCRSLSTEVHVAWNATDGVAPSFGWPVVLINETPRFAFSDGWSQMVAGAKIVA